MTSSLPEVRENEAPPEVAAIYDALKRATGLPVVNLIYRHLATLPGALPWVWSLVRGPILAGQAEQAAIQIAAGLSAPPLGPDIAYEADLHASDVESIRAILDIYHEGNILNLVCLTTILSAVNHPQRAPSSRSVPKGVRSEPSLSPQRAGVREAIPPLPRLGALSPEVAALVQSLAELHDRLSTAGVTPSLYLHLAHWPGFLRAVRTPLASQFEKGHIGRARSDLRRLAQGEAPVLAATMITDLPLPQRESLQAMRQVLGTFTQTVIPEMIVVGLVLRAVLPKNDAAQ